MTREQFERLGRFVLAKFEAMQTPTAVIAADAVHCHALIKVAEADAKSIFGRAKQFASVKLKDEIPGKLWGASSRVVRVGTMSHFVSVADYIERHRARGAWVLIRDDVSEEVQRS